MAIKRWEPTKSMEKFFEEMFEENLPSRFLRRFPRFKWMAEVETVSPAVDMFDKADEIVVRRRCRGSTRRT